MNRKVLLVENHDSLRCLIGAFLSRRFEVVGAKSGLEAMTRLSQGLLPDVIVTDARTPEIGGAQFLSNLRCSGLFANIPVVVIGSAADFDDEERHFEQLGVHAYFRKPFDPVALQNRLLQITG